MESAELATRARRVYEIGRVRWALHVVSVVLPLVFMSVLVAKNPLVSFSTGAALLIATVALRWRGQAAGAAVGPGLLAGLIPFALMLTLKCSSGYLCALDGCMAYCVRFCGIGGLASGLLLATYARRRDDSASTFLLAGGVVAALTGLLGCFVGGVMGALWMAIGEMAATLPALAASLRRR
jgi:hypothetical protein